MSLNVWDDASQWQIHLRREAWPQQPNLRFIVAAFDDILTTLWGLQVEEVILDFQDGSGYRGAAAQFFHSALMTGAFAARAQPNRGGETRPILSTEWVPEVVDRALATGTIERKLNGRRDDMWVYIDVAELSLMRKVLSLTDMLHQPDECGPLEAMGETILSNMSAIAKGQRPLDDKTAAIEVMRLLLRTIPQKLDEVDQNSVITAVTALLREKFDADPERLLGRDDFENPIIRTYHPHLSERMFDTAWRNATQWKDNTGKQPYKSRCDPGRKRAA